MSQPNPSTALGRVLIDELHRHGVRLVIASPGSRSAALAIAAQSHPGVETRVVLDERSASFQALGRAKSTGAPAAVISTSGTAPANHYPAVVEADMSLTPLVVISADRPSELHGVGANQTIDQKHLYGGKVRHFTHVDAPDAEKDRNARWRGEVADLVAAARGEGGRPGPVHLNVSFREPTVPVSDDGRVSARPYPFHIEGRETGAPWRAPRIPRARPATLDADPNAPGVIIAGEGEYDRHQVLAAAKTLGWAVLATAQSGLRGDGVVSAYHHILAGGIPGALRPRVVVAIGAIGPSQRLEELVAGAESRIRIDSWGRVFDPLRNATQILRADPGGSLQRLAQGCNASLGFDDQWSQVDGRLRASLVALLDETGVASGAGAVSALNRLDWDTLVAASSLPIREVDAHLVRAGRVIANRGASGIDGFVSTARGVASAGGRVIALSGDLSLLHDCNGLICDVPDDLVIVVLDNKGGGLFDSLPLATHAPSYERLFVAPPRRDLSKLAHFHQVGFVAARTADEMRAAVATGLDEPGISIVSLLVERQADLGIRRSLDEVGRSMVGSL